ncbi:CBS domain-containing protein [Streptomyces sp. NBC_00140]|uniref:restriction system modified-DNA reader domain-containing protein n=1 Tax=Streptomyces sp. NBC_00140 TaxID=2975664 RepID=UPI0022512350|nr:CBS domain-containing protein [Streptomyces sp. NBC_00140]MCX5328133.1 CBS domain-containing protein [Streptomyces sp. NBC_00140]
MTNFTSDADRGDPQGRASYLLAGKRVSISDLVKAGLLEVGAQLTFERPRVGETHAARVTENHLIELIDGQQFKSPSSAAIAAVGGGSFDGWHAWALDDGTTLDALRQQLLDSAAAQAPADEQHVDPSPARHERLKRAREAAEQGHPITLTVRDLLGWWGAARRGYLISRQVAAELANHSLSTSPDFDAVYLDAHVSLVSALANVDGDQKPEKSPPAVSPAVSHDDEDVSVVGLTVGNLPSAFTGVVAVSPSATFEEAITEMAINGYSQLPVLAGIRNLRGAVTWESIARTRHADQDAPFSKAIVRARDVSYDQHLIDVLPLLADFEFVLVRDQTNTISGIITANDVATAYGSMATPFFLIGEFDQRLRRILSDTFEVEYASTLCAPDGDREIASFDDLSIGDYQRILQNKEAWEYLGWPLDRKVFTKRIDELREIRNDLMHFNPDPIPDDAVQKIRHMIALLREYGG